MGDILKYKLIPLPDVLFPVSSSEQEKGGVGVLTGSLILPSGNVGLLLDNVDREEDVFYLLGRIK